MKISKYIFLLIGLTMLYFAFSQYTKTQKFLSEATITNGTVVEMIPVHSSDSTTYKPVIEFLTDSGQTIEFASSTSSNPPAYVVGESVKILYKESQPNQAKINSFFSLWGMSAILGGLGTVFFLIGFGMILSGKLKGRKIRYLKEHGMEVIAKCQGVELNRSISVNGRHPFQIHAQWTNPATSEVYIFKSDNIWFDPYDHIPSEDIRVLIDKNNPKKYHMDISFLPKLAN